MRDKEVGKNGGRFSSVDEDEQHDPKRSIGPLEELEILI